MVVQRCPDRVEMLHELNAVGSLMQMIQWGTVVSVDEESANKSCSMAAQTLLCLISEGHTDKVTFEPIPPNGSFHTCIYSITHIVELWDQTAALHTTVSNRIAPFFSSAQHRAMEVWKLTFE